MKIPISNFTPSNGRQVPPVLRFFILFNNNKEIGSTVIVWIICFISFQLRSVLIEHDLFLHRIHNLIIKISNR